jgi:hypothetical protein
MLQYTYMGLYIHEVVDYFESDSKNDSQIVKVQLLKKCCHNSKVFPVAYLI